MKKAIFFIVIILISIAIGYYYIFVYKKEEEVVKLVNTKGKFLFDKSKVYTMKPVLIGAFKKEVL